MSPVNDCIMAGVTAGAGVFAIAWLVIILIASGFMPA